MSRRTNLIAVHVWRSIAIAVTGGIVGAILNIILVSKLRFLTNVVAMLHEAGIVVLIVMILWFSAIAEPSRFLSAVRGLKALRFLHLGIIVRITLAFLVCLAVLGLVGRYEAEIFSFRAIALLAFATGSGLVAGYFTSKFMLSCRRPIKAVFKRPTERVLDDESQAGLDAWLAHDRPIFNEGESLIPAHIHVANRIFDRLIVNPDPETGGLPSVALIGPYGSGKTSICNLLEELYERKRKNGEDLPRVVFGQFEAWQYVSPEAATRGLVDAASQAVLKIVDVPGLWGLPEKYMRAIKEGGTVWTGILAVLVRGETDPGRILSVIGDTLHRLNTRLILFVDDLDRIEESLPEAQCAIVQALNQLQNVPNTQYAIAIGPTPERASQGEMNKPSHDLLKLTRFQELVPRFEPKQIVALIQQCRDKALSDTQYYYPWAEKDNIDKDPLAWKQFYSPLPIRGTIGALAMLLDTPRKLKSALRETNTIWNGGLNGEINWYDLISACALKASEPALFEFIMRDWEVFIHGPNLIQRTSSNQQQQEEAKELKEKLLSYMSKRTEDCEKIVLELLRQLFPPLAATLVGQVIPTEAEPWPQRIAFLPRKGRSYFERFASGCLSQDDVPDSPTLQYIRRIVQGEFDATEFRSLYLSSAEKLTGSLTKIIQFAALLPLKKALGICDEILAHVSEAGGPEDPPESAYLLGPMQEVIDIIARSDGRLDPDAPEIAEKESRISDWLEQVVEQYSGIAFRIPDLLLRLASENVWLTEDQTAHLYKKFAECIRQEYIEGERALVSIVKEWGLRVDDLSSILMKHPDYGQLRSKYTEKLIGEAEADDSGALRVSVVLSLVHCQPDYTVTSRDPVLRFSHDENRNEQIYDMAIILSRLKNWEGKELHDPSAAEALRYVKEAYRL